MRNEGEHEHLFTTRFTTVAKSARIRLDRCAHTGLAIGENEIVFSVLKALILRPLNVPRSDTSRPE
jgi:hypothetical protein